MATVDCPCIDTTNTLASLSSRRCKLPDSDGEYGIQLRLGGPCVQFSYGSSQCLQHDLIHDPACQVAQAGDHIIPAYCFRPWCFVDAAVCKAESNERVYRSSYLTYESGVDVFYSYSTCNSTADDWFEVEEQIVGSNSLGGISIHAAIPTYDFPLMYKRDPIDEAILSDPGQEYYKDDVTYEGAYPNYVKRVLEISRGDIQNITFTHCSKSSNLIHPESRYTAAIQDIKDGLVDMAIGPFWITGQRLTLTAFTIPIILDKTYLVVTNPGTNDGSYYDEMKKVSAPFADELWGLVLAIIFTAALLSVWFSDRSELATGQVRRRSRIESNRPKRRRRKRAYARLLLDSFIQKGSFFCSAGIEQDGGASLPNQVLMFGFGFFILITVSAYVANLAAFLTLSMNDSVKNMDGAVTAGMTICAHPALEAELKVAWPTASFYFHDAGKEFHGMLEDYDAKKCSVLAVGWEDTEYDAGFHRKLCDRNLMYTESVVVEMPIAFPIRSKLASGFSYWIHQGERYHDTSIEIAKEEFLQDFGCNVKYSAETESSETAQIKVKNMFFPVMFFTVCAVLSVLLQIIYQHKLKTGQDSLMGRRSDLSLVTDSNHTRRNPIAAMIQRAPNDFEINSTENGEGRDQLRLRKCTSISMMKGNMPLEANDTAETGSPRGSPTSIPHTL